MISVDAGYLVHACQAVCPMRGAGARAIAEHAQDRVAAAVNAYLTATVFLELQKAARAGSPLTEIAAAFMIVWCSSTLQGRETAVSCRVHKMRSPDRE